MHVPDAARVGPMTVCVWFPGSHGPQDKLLNNSYLNKGRPYALHPAVWGTAEEVVQVGAARALILLIGI